MNNTSDMINYVPSLAFCDLIGSEKYPEINGKIIFKSKNEGVLVTAEIFGLPEDEARCKKKVFALHIHEGITCSGGGNDPFVNSGNHFNPEKCLHPNHAGDLPPLFGNNGYAYMSVYTNRFDIEEVIGRTVIIHSLLDDFTTQPSGAAGEKIACGIIKIL